MSEFTAAELDRAYAFIMARMVEQGCAPHYTVLARTFGLDPEAGRRLLHALMATGIPCWLRTCSSPEGSLQLATYVLPGRTEISTAGPVRAM